jgi:5-formaminoimidazole-4-carboxamide-1-beta-D-ribofuranosyl 5'-monophosphate synthetase
MALSVITVIGYSERNNLTHNHFDNDSFDDVKDYWNRNGNLNLSIYEKILKLKNIEVVPIGKGKHVSIFYDKLKDKFEFSGLDEVRIELSTLDMIYRTAEEIKKRQL